MSLSPVIVFLLGLLLLGLLGWYLATEFPRRKRILGTALTILIVGICFQAGYPPSQKINLGIDLRGGTSFLIKLVQEGDREITPAMVDQAVEVIRKRIDTLGVSEPIITPQGADRILVQVPALAPEQVAGTRQQLEQVAKLEFKLVHPQSDLIVAGGAVVEPGYQIVRYKDTDRKGTAVERQLVLKRKADLTGEHVTHAYAINDPRGWIVTIAFDSEGGARFGDLTKQVFEERSRLAIVLDGEVVSAPGVEKGPIYGGNAEISGHFTEQGARSLASALQNPLQTPVQIMDQRSVSATLGTDSIRSGVWAGLAGLVVTLLFVLVYYKFAGVVANFALLINLVLIFGTMAIFGFTLTLPGIAGIILTIGMAVDANVLIYERLREELATGKNLRSAVDTAYDKAFSAIFDSNVTTLITAAILFWKASGPVKGFAVTLTVGILCSMFTSLLVTRTSFRWVVDPGLLQRINMLHLIRPGNFDFLGKRRIAVGASVLVILALTAVFALRGEKNFGYEFRGGDLLALAFQKKVPEADVRASLKQLGVADSVVQIERSAEKEFLTIRSPYQTSEKIEAHLKSSFPEAGFTEDQNDRVGSLVGAELARSSLIALGLSMIGIFIYVALRFESSFAVAAIVALLHDVLITVGAFAVTGRELSLITVGAVLTIAGYSINDTIVVFDRIREGIHSGRRGTLESIMNLSINQTLSRTILTGGTTLIPAICLLVIGGPVLNDFAFAIIVGVVVGTYSSVFVASPIVLWWAGHGGHKLEREVRRAQDSTVRA